MNSEIKVVTLLDRVFPKSTPEYPLGDFVLKHILFLTNTGYISAKHPLGNIISPPYLAEQHRTYLQLYKQKYF